MTGTRAAVPLAEVCRVMEIPETSLARPVKLVVLQGMVKLQRKRLAHRYHPDRPGGSTAKMQEINRIADAVARGAVILDVPLQQPNPVVVGNRMRDLLMREAQKWHAANQAEQQRRMQEMWAKRGATVYTTTYSSAASSNPYVNVSNWNIHFP